MIFVLHLLLRITSLVDLNSIVFFGRQMKPVMFLIVLWASKQVIQIDHFANGYLKLLKPVIQ